LAPGSSQALTLEKAREWSKQILPEGYGFQLEGAAAGLKEGFQSLGLALILGILVAYMILAIQFNSFVHPITILIALPFSLSGSLMTLWLFDLSLNLFSYIGIIVLMGIAKKNSILLVEFTNQLRERGVREVKQALIEACPTRLRPILMTSAATIAAALPLVLGDSVGQETRTPLGAVILGGTVVSTLFTLFVVPSLYWVLSFLERSKAPEPSVSSFRSAG
jgi:multidrug efflux pump subunit AcrB